MEPNITVNPNKVNGQPTKELFISMLTRDISLIDAISDMVDNCIDGAIRLKGDKKYTGLEIDITLTSEYFTIKDNCGGISKELASNYAFRFGRPIDAITVDHSVGQFGIGMKRALFKMGKKFEINSVSDNSSFSIEIDVNKWSSDKEWDFQFKKVKEGRNNNATRGTEITVRSLNKDVKERFALNNFHSELRDKLELQHLINLSKGMKIKINNYPIESTKLKLLNSNKFTTAYWAKSFKQYGDTHVEIYAGISEEKLYKGGWYIFCNNRLIKGPEQTEDSGWGVKTPVKIPKYHLQFSRFRGFVFFKSKKPIYLPWNTSKNSVDTDSALYQSVRIEMITLMRPVIDFLNKVHDESGAYLNKKLEEKYLQKEIDAATLKEYTLVRKAKAFSAPVAKKKARLTDQVIIKYTKPDEKVEKLKKVFSVASPKQVGEKTFEYVYDRECKE